MKSRIFRIFAIFLTALAACCFCLVAVASEDISAENKYYVGEAKKTGWDNGYSGEEIIKEGDPHFN